MGKQLENRMRLDDLPEFVAVEEFRRLFYPPLGRSLAYKWAKEHGVRIGARVYLPRSVIEGLLEKRGA